MSSVVARIADRFHRRGTTASRDLSIGISISRSASPEKIKPKTEREIQAAAEIIESCFSTLDFIFQYNPKRSLTRQEIRQFIDLLRTSQDVRQIARAAKSLIAAGQTRAIVEADINTARFESLIVRAIEEIRNPLILECKYWRTDKDGDYDAELYQALEPTPLAVTERHLARFKPSLTASAGYRDKSAHDPERYKFFEDLYYGLHEYAELLAWYLVDLPYTTNPLDGRISKTCLAFSLSSNLSRSLEYMMIAGVPADKICLFVKTVFQNCSFLGLTAPGRKFYRVVVPDLIRTAIMRDLNSEEIQAGLDKLAQKLAQNPSLLAKILFAYTLDDIFGAK